MRWLLVMLCACGRFGFEARSDDTPATDATTDSSGDGGTDASTDPDAAGDPDAASPDASMVTFAGAYTLLPNMNPPTARRATGAAVGNDGRIWIYGGFAGSSGVQSGVFAYTPSTGTWAQASPTGTPLPTRERHVLGWDAANNVLVLFGGYAGAFPSFTHHDELYFYTPGANTFTQIPKAGTWPAARKDAVMFWAPTLNAFLLYGGSNGTGTGNRFSDLWKLSINPTTPSATWTQITASGAAPVQSAPCATYEPSGRRLLIFGGETQDGTGTSTTYQYLVDTNAWQKDTPTGTVPSDRSFSACAWDPVASRLVLYGGQASSGNPIGGIFTYDPDAKRWEALPTANGSPTPGNNSDAGAVYSPALGATFVFGGRIASITYTNESWKLDVVAQ